MADVIDRANERVERDLELALEAQRRRAELHTLPATMDGRCLECGQPIGAARLEALPMTGRCIDCARIAEAQYRGAPWIA